MLRCGDELGWEMSPVRKALNVKLHCAHKGGGNQGSDFHSLNQKASTMC